MDNVQKCDAYINIPESQTYRTICHCWKCFNPWFHMQRKRQVGSIDLIMILSVPNSANKKRTNLGTRYLLFGFHKCWEYRQGESECWLLRKGLPAWSRWMFMSFIKCGSTKSGSFKKSLINIIWNWIWRVLPMVYGTQNHWNFGFYPWSEILNSRKLSVSDSRFVPVFRSG
jgi:hypothetical protein